MDSSCNHRKTPLYIHERMSKKGKQFLSTIMKIILILRTLWKGLKDPQKSLDHAWRTTAQKWLHGSTRVNVTERIYCFLVGFRSHTHVLVHGSHLNECTVFQRALFNLVLNWRQFQHRQKASGNPVFMYYTLWAM